MPALRRLAPLLWLSPAIALIGVVVLWPVVVMVQSSFQQIGGEGFVAGYNGTANYAHLFDEPDFVSVVKQLGSNEADWLGNPTSALIWMMAVAVFVSLPFTTYAILSGLQGIPGDVYEAAALDGATSWKSYLAVTLPLLQPAILVATPINVINVFNSFPIIWEMTGGGPGYETSTSTIYMVDLKQGDVGQSAAMSVINQYIGEYSVDWGHLFAAGLVATVPVIILFVFIERRVMGGLTAGAVK